MKYCAKCRTEKPLSEFNKNTGRKDGLQAQCRDCGKSRNNANYQENAVRRSSIRSNADLSRQRTRKYVREYLKTHPCVDCGEDDPIVLDFDHVRGEKLSEISTLAKKGWSLDKIVDEITKCDVRCANCHRRVTHRRRNAAEGQRVDRHFGKVEAASSSLAGRARLSHSSARGSTASL